MASTFKLLEISSVQIPNKKYVLNENTGEYVSSIDNTDKYNLLDFICKHGYRITKVQRKSDNYIVSLGDVVKVNETDSIIVDTMIIKKSHIIINNAIDLITLIKPTPKVNPKVENKIKSNNFFNTLQTKIENSFGGRRISLGGFTNTCKTLQEFLINFINDYNNRFNTVYYNSGNTQTSCGRRRSLGDIYMICKFYFPNIELIDVVKLLYGEFLTTDVFKRPNTSKDLRTSYCSTINKRVWYSNTNNFLIADEFHYDEYGNTIKVYQNELEKALLESKPKTKVKELSLIFKPGVKFRSLVSENTFKIGSNITFEETIRNIILIDSTNPKDVKRRIIFDNINNKQAQIVS